jgi:SAM-dependent methyltransferase
VLTLARRLAPGVLKRGFWTLRTAASDRRRARSRKRELRRLMRVFGVRRGKHAAELEYWQMCWEREGGRLNNEHFRKRFLAMAGEPDAEFLRSKVVADFGCGPRGSLCWATAARERIGVDVLVDAYRRFGIERHNMTYVRSYESHIPLATHSIDVLFTLNALDHVDRFEPLCAELLRILRPGGTFIGSFNLDEPPSETEPQLLTEERIAAGLLRRLRVVSYRVAPKGPDDDCYRYFFRAPPPGRAGPRILWVRGEKPSGVERPAPDG